MRTTRPYTVRASISALLLLLFALFCPLGAVAHPMGNFSVNHYGKIKIGQSSVEVLYLVDMAEIPTYQEMRQSALTINADDPNDARYIDIQARSLRQGLAIELDGQPMKLDVVSRQIAFTEGAGGLPTMKLAFVFRADIDTSSGSHRLSYVDNNFPGHAGWKEIVVVGDGPAILESTASSIDRSNELSTYSSDSLNSPPQQLSALVSFQTAVPPGLGAEAIKPSSTAANLQANQSLANQSLAKSAAQNTTRAAHPLSMHMKRVAPTARVPDSTQLATNPATNIERKPAEFTASNKIALNKPAPRPQKTPQNTPQNTPRSRFTELISTQQKLGFWILFSAALIAAGLGALHALEPGHGKTIVAAYLVGSRGTAGHAVLLGLVVTASHTAGVYLLGVITLYASRYIVPEQLYPWLGAISGLSVTGVGVFMLLRYLTGESGDHSHAPGEQHSHWFLSIFKKPVFKKKDLPQAADRRLESTSIRANRGVSLRELCLLGITGGIVPCPAALVVLLSAFSLHRIGFGLFLITAFSLGLAAVLVAVGLIMVYAKQFVAPRVNAEGSILRHLPLLSSSFMAILGIGIAISALASAPIGHNLLSKEKLLPFVTVTLLGLFLGMRHSTDPDHVVAVSTIVSRQQSVKSSAKIGLLWGLGHTLTIFLVGSAIIIFGVVIPPRLGLSMEFCVALMLILLGVLNLTGIMRWITERFTAAKMVQNSPQPCVVSNLRQNDEAQPAGDTMIGRITGKLGLYQTLRPLAVGLVHGLAGSAAIALLVLSTIKNPFWSTAYLLVFGLGTMAGMMLMTAAISAPLVFAGRKFFHINRHLTTISGLASTAFGMFLVYHIGFVDGLFTSHVHWIPQ